MEKAYTLREIKADDIFLMLRVIKKIGLKEAKACFESEDVKKAIAAMSAGQEVTDVSSVGMAVMLEIADVLISHLPDCKDDLYKLLEALSGMSAAEIADLPMATFIDMVMDVIKKDEFKDFFQRVVGSKN
jgi:hypothetical protein